MIGRGFHQIFQIAHKYKITDKLGEIIKKKPNAIHKTNQTMNTIFKGFIQTIRIYHFRLKNTKANISTYYRDLRRCNKESYEIAKNIMESFYSKVRKKKRIVITIDGTFIGVRGKKYENAHKMYSRNRKDKGKKGYTIVTCFDSTNKMPITFEVPQIHEIHAFSNLIEKATELERKRKIKIDFIVLDALYLNKEILDILSNHKYIIRAPSHEWLIRYVEKSVERGCKDLELWGHKIKLYWKKDNEQYELLITNSGEENIWKKYGHYKQMVENYHNDLKNKFGIRNLPSRKFYAILVYFAIILLIYILTRALLLGFGLNNLSCGMVIVVAYNSYSKKSFLKNLLKFGKRRR